MSVISNHPNAAVSGGVSGAGALVVWGLSLLGVAVPPAIAVVAVGLLASAVLAVGKHGVKGLVGRLWRGDEPVDPGPAGDHPTDGGVG